MAQWSAEQEGNYFNSLYVLLLEEARMSFKRIGYNLKINNKTAAKLYRAALREKVLFPPLLRLKSFPNLQEYTYFLKFKNAASVYEKFKEDPRIVYQCVCSGAFDLMIVATERIDVSMENGFEYIVLSGPRGDFVFNKVERRSMYTYFDEFENFLRSGDFVPSEIVVPERGELPWDDLDLALFRLLKHDLRMKYSEIIKCLGLSKSTFYPRLDKVLGNCTVWTRYYPKGYPNYNGYFILFRTKHEKQLTEKLKKIPVHCFILKVKSWVYAYILIEKDLIQRTFLDLLRLMQSSGFVEEYRYSVPLFHWNREWTTQELRRHSPHHKE